MGPYATTTLQNAATATGNGTVIDLRDLPTVAIHFVNVGSPVGTVAFEGTLNGSDAVPDWVAVPVENAAGSLVTTATAAGFFRLPVNHGLHSFRARISIFTSGAFTVLAGRS